MKRRVFLNRWVIFTTVALLVGVFAINAAHPLPVAADDRVADEVSLSAETTELDENDEGLAYSVEAIIFNNPAACEGPEGCNGPDLEVEYGDSRH